ncbi:MAG: DUF1343 domain-containing protein [Calditrichaeota bacterium]|nr:DUF1343 domain-containing protein [Calditrichota bacterium]
MRKIQLIFVFLIVITVIIYLAEFQTQARPVTLGLDELMGEQFDLIKGKRVGVITNQTGVDSQNRHIADLLSETPEVELVALFGPEHGIRGDVEGGYQVENNKDTKTGVPIFSIYGKTKKPTPEMLAGLEALIFDIQDVGTRFYTFISTMSLCMEAAAEQGIPFIVLDRPNPIGGVFVEGPVLDPEFKSFVGIHPIALRHGMTVGELAKMFNGEGWLKDGVRADLHVVKMRNWRRDSYFSELNLKWIKPSPNMPSPMTALLYPGMGLLESCNVSEGRGTTRPFEKIGAPWIDHVRLKSLLDSAAVPGIEIDTVSFIPQDMPGAAMNPEYEDELCRGLFLHVTDPHRFPAVEFGLRTICAIKRLHPKEFHWNSPRSPLIMFGDRATVEAIDRGETPEKIMESWQEKLTGFLKIRKKYLIYD